MMSPNGSGPSMAAIVAAIPAVAAIRGAKVRVSETALAS